MKCPYLEKNSCPQYRREFIKFNYCDEENCKYAKEFRIGQDKVQERNQNSPIVTGKFGWELKEELKR